MTVAAVASLVVGLTIGFVGQRSRMCFVAGIRDWILVRDTALLKGLVAFLLVGWILFPVVSVVGDLAPASFAEPVALSILLTAIGGFGVGVISIRAEGCPFRQHVLGAQGSGTSMLYLVGFLTGAVVFHTVVAPLLGRVLI